ncbi:hypothetical protein BV20DRAFT_980558 [Pilatotrama ljubarskyi]|nr:hypothetical protein BV20DRAFT_980558 [Pilatotrama ljubarskyi]
MYSTASIQQFLDDLEGLLVDALMVVLRLRFTYLQNFVPLSLAELRLGMILLYSALRSRHDDAESREVSQFQSSHACRTTSNCSLLEYNIAHALSLENAGSRWSPIHSLPASNDREHVRVESESDTVNDRKMSDFSHAHRDSRGPEYAKFRPSGASGGTAPLGTTPPTSLAPAILAITIASLTLMVLARKGSPDYGVLVKYREFREHELISYKPCMLLPSTQNVPHRFRGV